MEFSSITIALSLASIGLAITLVGGVVFIFIALAVQKTSDEFARKADMVDLDVKADTDEVNKLSNQIQENLGGIFPQLENIEKRLKKLEKTDKDQENED